MLRRAKALIREVAIERVRLIEAELSVGDPGAVAEPKDPSQRHWRFKKARWEGQQLPLGVETGKHEQSDHSTLRCAAHLPQRRQ
jgi:hypothetical protein